MGSSVFKVDRRDTLRSLMFLLIENSVRLNFPEVDLIREALVLQNK